MHRFFLPLTNARGTLHCWPPIEIAALLRASSYVLSLERAVYELPLLDDTVGPHPLAIPMRLGVGIESAVLVDEFFRDHLQTQTALPLEKGAVDPFAQTALSRLCSNSRAFVKITAPPASAQIASEFTAATKMSHDASATGDDPP